MHADLPAGNKAPDEAASAHRRCGPLLAAPHSVSPCELDASCSWHARTILHQVSMEVTMSSPVWLFRLYPPLAWVYPAQSQTFMPLLQSFSVPLLLLFWLMVVLSKVLIVTFLLPLLVLGKYRIRSGISRLLCSMSGHGPIVSPVVIKAVQTPTSVVQASSDWPLVECLASRTCVTYLQELCFVWFLVLFHQFYTHATSDIFSVGVKALKALDR